MQRVLIIEDETAIARALEEKLRHAGLETGVMLWGETQMDFIKAFHPDVILLDLLLPKHSGLEVLHGIRADDTLKSTPVLVLSNFGGEGTQKTAQDLGISGYFVKSQATLEDIVLEIRKVLAGEPRVEPRV